MPIFVSYLPVRSELVGFSLSLSFFLSFFLFGNTLFGCTFVSVLGGLLHSLSPVTCLYLRCTSFSSPFLLYFFLSHFRHISSSSHCARRLLPRCNCRDISSEREET